MENTDFTAGKIGQKGFNFCVVRVFRGKYSSLSKRVKGNHPPLAILGPGKRHIRKSRPGPTGRDAMENLPKKKLDLGHRIGIQSTPKHRVCQTTANRPRSMLVPTEIDLLSTRVDSYRHPIDTKSIPYRHPKIPVLLPAANRQNRERSTTYRHE